MSAARREPIRCPVSDHLLMTGFWVAEVLELRTVCKCGRLVQINRDYSTEIVYEHTKRQVPQD